MATGILSKGTTLSFDATGGSAWKDLPDLQEVPELGSDAEKVETTTLDNGYKSYIKGLKDYGDLDFTFLYDNSTANSSFRLLTADEALGTESSWKVSFPDGTTFIFKGFVSVKTDSVGTNAPITFTASIAVSSDFTIANPLP